MDLEEQLPLPKRSYVYAIHVDGVLRYIGKGTDDRMYAHMKEVSQRLTRKFKLKNVSPFFQRNPRPNLNTFRDAVEQKQLWFTGMFSWTSNWLFPRTKG